MVHGDVIDMRHTPVLTLGFVTLLTPAVFSCNSSSACSSESLLGPDHSIVPVSDVDFQPPTSGIDGVFSSIAQEVPSFAGFFQEDGDLVIQVADPAQKAAAVETVRSEFGGYLEGLDPRPLVVQFSFLELARWRTVAALNVGKVDVVTSFDVDEKENAVGIGVTSTTCASDISRILQEAGIPADAIRIFQEGAGVAL